MSRISKRNGSKYYWYTTGTPPNRIRLSTGQTNIHVAKLKQKELDQLYEAGRLSVVPKTVQGFIDTYLVWHKENKKPDWHKRVRQGLATFYKLYGNILMSDINIDHIGEYKKLRSKERARNTVNHELSMLSGLFKYAQMRKMVISNPADSYFISRHDTSEDHRDPIPIDMIKEVLELTDNPRDKAMISLSLYTGIRAADAGTLTKDNIKDRFIEWRQGKGVKPVTVPKHPILSELDLVNIAPKSSQRNRVTERLQRKLMDLYEYKSDFHSIRHTFATRLADLELDHIYIKFLMGHRMDDITWRYMHKKVESFRPYVDAI